MDITRGCMFSSCFQCKLMIREYLAPLLQWKWQKNFWIVFMKPQSNYDYVCLVSAKKKLWMGLTLEPWHVSKCQLACGEGHVATTCAQPIQRPGQARPGLVIASTKDTFSSLNFSKLSLLSPNHIISPLC